MRGGSTASTSSATSASAASASDSSSCSGKVDENTLRCVMQAPPGVRGSTSNGGEEDISRSWKKVLKSSATSSASVKNGKKYDRPVAVEYVAETKLPTDMGHFTLRAYRVPGAPLGQEPCVIYSKAHSPFGGENVPVRIHDQCLTSEVFRSQRCDCKEQLQMALKYIQKNGGCIIYLQQEGRGIGLANKIAAYALQDIGLDTVDANLHLGFPEDSREYGVVPSILADMNIRSIQLMTNNPRKTSHLEALGIKVDKTLPMVVPQTNPYNRKYLETKQTRMHHQNFANLLAYDPNVPTVIAKANGIMTPRKHLADQYINNGTEMTANAVQVSLMLEEDDVATFSDDEEGVKAADDGYCFGKQSVLDAIAAVARGEMVVVVDDMDRENEGDFIMAADRCTDLDMARIVRYSSGVICVALEGKRMDELNLPPMLSKNEDPKGTAFSVTVDASKGHGITTGISASDRAKTVQLLANLNSEPTDFVRPGHIFPLRARDGGVLERDGHTEASVDLARLAGRSPVGVLCEIVSEEDPTEMMRLPEMKRFCKRHGFVMTSIVDIAQYRREMGI